MPRTYQPEAQRKLWSGMGSGLDSAVYLVTATAVWAGIGFGLDRWLGTWPVLFAIGAVLGNAAGVYVIYRRSIGQTDEKARTAAAGVTRAWPAPGNSGAEASAADATSAMGASTRSGEGQADER